MMKYMLGSVIVEEEGLVDKVSDLKNRAQAKPSHYFHRKETFL